MHSKWGRVTRIRVDNRTIIGSDNGLTTSHYINQSWIIRNWPIGNIFQWNLHQNSTTLLEEKTFTNVVWKMATVLSRPQCVNLPVIFPSACTTHCIKVKWVLAILPWWRHDVDTIFSVNSPLWGNPPVTDGLPSQMDIDAEWFSLMLNWASK